MRGTHPSWDYLIITASNDLQARAYEAQLALRRELGLLGDVGAALVIGDPDGQRIGSGGSTLFCLMTVLNREIARSRLAPSDWNHLTEVLDSLRILIIHAGGDSRRLPAYGPCGKIFVPVPGSNVSTVGTTLFDRQLPVFGVLPAGRTRGQVVVTSGDALIRFNPDEIRFNQPGMTALGSYAAPEHAAKHGVFCAGSNGQVRLYLQKPKPAEQIQAGALNEHGQAILDIGVMSFDAGTAAALLRAFDVRADQTGRLTWAEPMQRTIVERGLDIYREVCCALGAEATAEHHLRTARASGSTWDEATLAGIYASLRAVPFYIQVVSQCSFLHFGTTLQLITSGIELQRQDLGTIPDEGVICLNTDVRGAGAIQGAHAWIEGCRVSAPVSLGGQNVLIGVDLDKPLSFPPDACLDVLRGRDRRGKTVWFVRCYGVRDTFKDKASTATLCGLPVLRWLEAAGATPDDIWGADVPEGERSLWNARVFPAEPQQAAYGRWLWMYQPVAATPDQKRMFLGADRYSVAEMAILADQREFYARRERIRQATNPPSV